MHLIAEAFLLPGIGATIAKRQFGAAGQKARLAEQPIGLFNSLVPPEQLCIQIQAGQGRPL